MNSMAMLEEVAAGKITPEDAANEMMRAREEARALPRPRWLPSWAWAAGAAVITLTLAAFGIQRDRA